jgi:hypothetical protein
VTTYIVGIVGAALLVGLLALARPSGNTCGSACGTCPGGGACKRARAAEGSHDHDHDHEGARP